MGAPYRTMRPVALDEPLRNVANPRGPAWLEAWLAELVAQHGVQVAPPTRELRPATPPMDVVAKHVRIRCRDCGRDSVDRVGVVRSAIDDAWLVFIQCHGATFEHRITGLSVAKAMVTGGREGMGSALLKLFPDYVGQRPYPPGPEVP